MYLLRKHHHELLAQVPMPIGSLMKHLLFDLRFILRNWRYFHAHGVLLRELREWWNDYDQLPARSPIRTDYNINVSSAPVAQMVADMKRHVKGLVG